MRLAVLVGVAALLACMFPLRNAWVAHEDAKERLASINALIKKRQAQVRREKLEEESPETTLRQQSRSAASELVRFSWEGFFDVLEISAKAVNGGVSIVAMTPSKVATGQAQVNLTALASNVPIMLSYLDNLRDDPRMMEVELLTQQPDDKTGPNVIRFQANLVWSPEIYIQKTPVQLEAIQQAEASAQKAAAMQSAQPTTVSPGAIPVGPLYGKPQQQLVPQPQSVSAPFGPAATASAIAAPKETPTNTPIGAAVKDANLKSEGPKR
jgi:hypothetical protein